MSERPSSPVRAMSDALRLMLGTLTVFPVRPPATVDRRVGARAMAMAPLGGLLLALGVAGPLLLGRHLLALDPLVAAVLAIGLLAVLTRALHLDGLADTADGLGSARRGDGALQILRRSDIGPFGVVTLVLTLLLQVALLRYALLSGYGELLLAAAVVVSRGVLPLVCVRALPAARPDGLGRAVAGSLGPLGVMVGLALTVGIAGGVVVAGNALTGGVLDTASVRMLLVATLLGLPAGIALTLRAARRFGGVTGDVLGAAVETTFTTALLLGVLLA